MPTFQNTYMGLAPGFDSSGGFTLENFKFAWDSTRIAVNTTAATIFSADSGTFHLVGAQSSAVDITLPAPEAGAFYGFVFNYASSIGTPTFKGPTTAVTFVVGGGAGVAASTNVSLVTTGTGQGAVVGFLGISATQYAFLNLGNQVSSAYTSATSAAISALWGVT